MVSDNEEITEEDSKNFKEALEFELLIDNFCIDTQSNENKSKIKIESVENDISKDLSRKSYSYMCFELLRLRTRYDNEKDNAVKVRIAKRYREVRKEFDSRGSQWIPSEHELDRIIKAVEEKSKDETKCSKCS